MDLRRTTPGHRPLQRRERSGFTLIEVVVSIVIASITVAALFTMFTAQSRQFLMQDMQMEMHQNLRFATDMLTRSLRMAGYGTGGEVTGVFGYSSPDDELPVLISWDANGDNETDAVTVVYADPSLVMDTNNAVTEACSATTITFRPSMLENDDKLSQFEEGDLLICFDYADIRGLETYMWELSADPDTANGLIYVTANSSYSDYADVCGSSENLTPVMTCSKARVMTFYIDDDDSDSTGPGSEKHPVLMLDLDMDWPEDDDVPLVDDIEDLQIEYCVDDGTESTDCSSASNWDDEFDTDNVNSVWMARVSLIARSSREEARGKYQSTRPSLGNRDGADDSDSYYRQVLATEVTVRNNRYQANL